MIIGKHFEFEASHQLPNEECYGQCSFLHGHTYKLTIEVEGEITTHGWVMNFKELKDIVKRKIIDALDHKHLNDIIALPTVEILLIWIESQLQDELRNFGRIKSITLYETSDSYAKIEN